MKRLIAFIATWLAVANCFSQAGKDGAGNISASATVNIYTAVNADAAAGSTTISVASAAGFTTGDLLYIIQMQGASVNCYTTALTGTASSAPFSSAYGKITNYNNAGNNEYVQVASISGNTITIDCGLRKNYTAAGKVQVLRVPRYSSLNITATGTITCPPWNGTTGGVIAIEVNGNTTISNGGRIDASALGFRGGITIGKNTGITGGASYGHNNNNEGGYKGEGIAGDVLTYSVNWQGLYARGAVANAGGGGDANNAGGGGGANGGDTSLYTGSGNPDISVLSYTTAWELEQAGFSASSSSGGGRGGYCFSSAAVSPLTYSPGDPTWSGDNRRQVGGLGGRPLNYNTGKLFCGGGGGAGDENDTYGGGGGNGGGIINILSYGTMSGGGQIVSNGQNGLNTITSPVPFNAVGGRDGAGGGGGGGAILVNSSGAITNLTLSAKGGNGGNQNMVNNILFGGTTAMAYGPGGGGGGGYIGTTPATVTSMLNGGPNGIVQYLSGVNNCQIDNQFPSNGSTIGGNGTNSLSAMVVAPTLTATAAVTICAGSSTIVNAATSGTGTIGWYTATAGGTLLGTGSPFTTSVFPTPGTYTLFAGFCPGGIYRKPVVITVTGSPTLSSTTSTICNGQTATLVASGASSYTWNTGSNSATINPTPSITTVYTVTGGSGSCTTAITATVVVSPAGTISVNSSTICSGQSSTLTAGAAASYTWSTGSNNQSITVTPTASAVYTINATIGGCIATNTSMVTVNNNPTVSAVNASICSGASTLLTASGASSYTWSTGALTSTVLVSPGTSTVYTVTGSSSGCIDTKTVSVNVTTTPTLSANTPSICAGQTAVITASGATTYSWNTGPTTVSISVSPSVTTVYTVTGTNGSCTSAIAATVVVSPSGTIGVNSATVCSGQTATLTAGAATGYTWSNGSNNQSITVTPTANTVYTIVASSGGCSASNTSTVTVNPNPTVSVNNATMCSGQSVTLTASGATTYSWSTGASTASISASPTVSSIYTVTGTSGLCSSSQTAAVNITSAPTVSLNSNVFNICGGQSATIIANAATGTYSWSTGSTSSVITASVAGVYNVTVTNVCGSAVQSATVNSGVPPAFTIAPSSTVLCSGQSLTLNTVGSSGTFTWSNGSGNTPSLVINSPGAYTATLTNGCGVATGSIDIGSGPSTNMSIIATSNTICSGGSVTLTAIGTGSFDWSTGDINASSITVTNTGIYTATVSNSCGTGTTSFNVTNGPAPSLSITPSSPSFCNGQSATLTATGSSGTYSWSNGSNGAVITTSVAGTYTAVVTNSCGTGSNTFNVVFQAVPSVSLTASANTICPNGSATLTANGVNGGSTYSWSSSPSNTSNIEMATAPGTYVVTYSNACGSATAAASISQSTLLPDFTFSPNGGIAPVTVSFNNTSINNAMNSWNFGNGSSSSNASDNSNYTAPGIYSVTLMITNSDGCQASVTKTLEVSDQELLIPDAFTPNGDGKNDLFEIRGIERYPNNELQVFNRWGNLVYSMKSYNNSWDGTPNAKSMGSGKLPSGTYFYIFALNDGSGQVFRAYVQLVY